MTSQIRQRSSAEGPIRRCRSRQRANQPAFDVVAFPDVDGYTTWCKKVKAFVSDEYHEEVLELIEDLDLIIF